jgi:Protein of unknown function (DUF2924)
MSWTSHDADLEAQITGLEVLATNALRIEWRKLHRAEPPTRLSRDLLIRGIAFKIQERAYGGLNPAAQRRLRSLAGERTGSSASVFSPGITPKPATKLVREWQGRAHTVTVLEEGFDYGGECQRRRENASAGRSKNASRADGRCGRGCAALVQAASP